MIFAPSGLGVCFCRAVPTRPSSAKNAFAQKAAFTKIDAEKRDIRDHAPEERGPDRNHIVMGKHSGRASVRFKLEHLGYDWATPV